MSLDFFALYIAPIFYRVIYMSLTALSFGLFFAVFGKTLDKIISPKWKYIFWFLMLIALVIPFRIKSPISISDLLNLRAIEEISFYKTAERVKSVIFDFLLPCIWIIGIAVNFAGIIIGRRRLEGKINKALSDGSSEEIRDKLAICCDALELSSSRVRVVVWDYINTPAVTGFFSPVVLLPRYFCDLKETTATSVLLHELAHFKRGDIRLNFLLSVIKAVYWFNPLVYPLVKKFKEDIELANDAYVLSVIGEKNHQHYRNAVFENLTHFSKTASSREVLCMADTAGSLKRRIKMLDSNVFFKKKSLAITALCTAASVLGAMLFLSSAGIERDVSLEVVSLKNNTVWLEFTNGSFSSVKTEGKLILEKKTDNGWKRIKSGSIGYINSEIPLSYTNSPKESYEYGEGFSLHCSVLGLEKGELYRIKVPYKVAGTKKFAEVKLRYNEPFNADSITKSDLFSRPDDGADAYLKGEISSIIRKNRSGMVYEIKDNETLKRFVYAMKAADWFDGSGCFMEECSMRKSPLYEIEVKGENPVKFKFYQICDRNADVDVIVNDIIIYSFFTNAESALRIKSFCEKSYELHFTANQHTPSEDSFITAQYQLLDGMKEEDKKSLKKSIRDYHKYLEFVILCGIESDIKEPEGLYWNGLLNGFDDMDTSVGWNYEVYGNEFMPELKTFVSKNEAFNKCLDKIQNKTAASELEAACQKIEDALKTRDIQKLFDVHKLIHDYDYFIANYPTKAGKDGFVDSSGLNAYFGETKLLGENKW